MTCNPSGSGTRWSRSRRQEISHETTYECEETVPAERVVQVPIEQVDGEPRLGSFWNQPDPSNKSDF